MLTSIHVKNFRNFENLKIEGLKGINLIAGQNNTGKTGLLEAIFLLLRGESLESIGNLSKLFRPTTAGINEYENFWKWLFFNKNEKSEIQLEGVFGVATSKYQRILRRDPLSKQEQAARHLNFLGNTGGLAFHEISTISNHPKAVVFPVQLPDPLKIKESYSKAVKKGNNEEKLEELLAQVDPQLKRIRLLEEEQSKTTLLYIKVGPAEMIPLTQMGQGFSRLLEIYSEVLAKDAKVLLIDEIENGLHHSILNTVWKNLFQSVSDLGIQIFATTHSLECILAADKAAREGDNYNLNIIRLDRVKGDIKATSIDSGTVDLVKELGWEIR